MSKKKYVAISIILLMLILCATLITKIPTVKGSYDYDYLWASNLYTTNWLQMDDNGEVTYTALCQIEDLFSEQKLYVWLEPYGWIHIGHAYGEVQNWGSTETPNDVYNQIDHDNEYHSDFATVLYVGHGGPNGFYGYSSTPNNQYNPPPLISYDVIQSHTQASATHKFAFNWVCYGGNNAPNGAPKAWNPLYWSNPGVYTPYTWIGFDTASPWLIDEMGTYGYYGEPNIYKYWLVFFYYYALNGNSIMTALDEASRRTGFDNFGSSILGTGDYETYWPYYPDEGWYSGRMHVCGAPLTTYLPTDTYIWIL